MFYAWETMALTGRQMSTVRRSGDIAAARGQVAVFPVHIPADVVKIQQPAPPRGS